LYNSSFPQVSLTDGVAHVQKPAVGYRSSGVLAGSRNDCNFARPQHASLTAADSQFKLPFQQSDDLLVGMIVSLTFIRGFMPEYDYGRMQLLYALTVPIVAVVTLLGLIGVEKRRRPRDGAATATVDEATSSEPRRNEAALLLRFVRDAAVEPNSRNFFLFIFRE